MSSPRTSPKSLAVCFASSRFVANTGSISAPDFPKIATAAAARCIGSSMLPTADATRSKAASGAIAFSSEIESPSFVNAAEPFRRLTSILTVAADSEPMSVPLALATTCKACTAVTKSPVRCEIVTMVSE